MQCEFTNELRTYREDIQIVCNYLAVEKTLCFLFIVVMYDLLLGLYLKDFLILSPILLMFYMLTVLPTLFLLADVRSKSMRALIFTLLLLIGLIDLTYLFRCRRIFPFPTIISLVIVLIYFGTYIEEPKKDGFLTKNFVLAVMGIVAVNLISAYRFMYNPKEPYLDNGRDTMWNTQTEELADELSSNCETDAEKVKVFHKWIVENFEYDF